MAGFDLSFATRDVSFRYSNRPFFDFFRFGSWTEAIIFMAIFFIGFTVSYYGLKRFFTYVEGPVTRRDNQGNDHQVRAAREVVKNKNALIVISLCLSVLMTIGIMRVDWMVYYIGDLGAFLFIGIVSFFIFMLVLAALKFMGAKTSNSVSAPIAIATVWIILKFAMSRDFVSDFSTPIYEGLLVLTNIWALVIGLVLGFVLGKLLKK